MTSAPAQTSIPFFNYRGAFAAREDEFIDIIRDVLRRGAFIQQRDLAEFEQALASYLGVKYAFGVANATDGLIISLRAAGIRPGDEVIFRRTRWLLRRLQSPTLARFQYLWTSGPIISSIRAPLKRQ